jgi:CubicO group peptidase (beta-lactamase class C family)
MNKIFSVVLLVFFISSFSVSVVKAQNNSNLNKNRIDTLFKKWDRPGSPGCAAGVYHEGKIVFSKGYGGADLEKNRPITPNTIFRVASLSKQFTAAAIALLSIRNEIDLDQPVRNYIPDLPDYNEYSKQVTVRQLVHHTSGIPDLFSLLALYDISLKDTLNSAKLLKTILSQSHLNFKPGSKYMYSNSGYAILGALVEKVSGQPLQKYLEENLFNPLGMNNSHFHNDRNHVMDQQAFSYRSDGNGQFKMSYLPNFEGLGPTGLYTTIEDMFKWNQQLYNNKLSNAKGFNKLMHQRGIPNNGDTLSYAFALNIDKYKGQKTVGHSGVLMGFRTNYLRIPNQQYGSVLLCNLGNIDPGKINKKMSDIFLEKPYAEWLRKFEGTYYSEELDLKYRFEVKEADLYLYRGKGSSEKITYIKNSTFRFDEFKLNFKLSKHKVESLNISSDRAKNLLFKKVS